MDIIRYYLLPKSTPLNSTTQNISMQISKNKYTSYTYLYNFILDW